MKNKDKKSSKSDENTLAHIARRYYIDKVPQKIIADELQISQAEVSNCIKLAEEHALVRFTIDQSFEEDLEPLQHNLLYLPLNVLRKHVEEDTATVVAVAGGRIKHEPVLSALRGKLFNVSIIDALTVEYILGEVGKEPL